MDRSGVDKLPRVLSIAGFDPSGGAGILADARAFMTFGCTPTAAVTSITFQNQDRVHDCIHQHASTVRSQILPILSKQRVDALKTGMLPTAEIVLEVAHLVREYKLKNLVVDPVIRSTSGYELADEEATSALKDKLIPLARVVTPNIPEAETLVGFSIENEEQMLQAAELLRQGGAQAVLIKGGHLRGATQAVDLLLDGNELFVLRDEWIDGRGLHGTGCLLSAAIAAGLAKGDNLQDAAREAKSFVLSEIRKAC